MSDSNSVGDLLAQLVKEGKRRIVLLSAVFTLVALIGLAVVILRPKKYECNATLLVTSSAMLGTSGQPQRGTDPTLVTQIVMGRTIMREILAVGGWTGLEDPRVEDIKLNELRGRVRISNARPELIKIAYVDTLPERCYVVTTKLTEVYIREAVAPTERDTRKAVEILDRQVADYRVKLADAHEQVLAHYRSREAPSTPKTPTRPSLPDDPGAEPKAPPQPREPAAGGGGGISQAELVALKAEEATLIAELRKQQDASGKTPTLGRDEQRYRERSLQLSAELDRLLTVYTEEHPDVKRARRELDRVRSAEDKARQDREEAEATARELDNQMAAATRARLEEVQRRIAAAENAPRRPRPDGRPEPVAPISPTAPLLDPDLRIIQRDSVMTELLRQYETTRDIYQDLLKRREIARVQLQLAEETGLGLKVQEPAEMPLTAISTRLMYMVAAALFMAGLAPIAMLFALVRLDPRLRSARDLQAKGEIPFLVGIPFVPQYRDRVRARRQWALAVLLVVLVMAAYLTFFIIRLKAAQ
jgi:hypothetical protein